MFEALLIPAVNPRRQWNPDFKHFSGFRVFRFECARGVPADSLFGFADGGDQTASMPDDAALLRRYARESAEEAFAEVVRRHLDAVFSAALRRVGGDRHLAEDVAQQVFTAVARGAGRLSRHPHLSAWLYATTRNVAANVVRGERRRKAREQEAQLMQEILKPGEPEADWSRVAPVLDAAIDELGAADRTAILLRFVDHESFVAIGARLGLSADAARMRVDRALEKLRARLDRSGVVSTAAALSLALAGQAVSAAPAGMAASVTGSVLATASSGAAVTTVLNFFHFMTISKLAGSMLVVAAFLTVGTAVRQHYAARETHTASVAATRAVDVLQVRIRTARQRADFAEKNSNELQTSLAAALTTSPAAQSLASLAPSATPRLPEPSAQEQIDAGQAFLAANPELMRVFKDGARERVAARYHLLYAQLGLTPAQIVRFEDLMAGRRELLHTDFEGLPRMRLAATPALAGDDGVDDRLRELLGQAGYQEYLDFSRPTGAHQTVLKIASQLHATPTPLTADQAAHLQRILMEARQGTQQDWNAVFERSRGMLAEFQLATLRGLQAQDELTQAINDVKRRVAAGANSP